jgi:hypothetical protein
VFGSLNYGTITQDWLYIIALLVALGIFAYIAKSQDYLKLDRLLLFLQFPIPLIFANNLISRYVYQDQVYSLPFAPAYYIYFVAIIAALSFWNVKRYQKIKAAASGADADYIFPSTFITIFTFNSYYYPAKILQSDFWHFGEQMISWQQIVGQGRAAYQDYMPPSGLFAMVDGFFQNVLLTGMATDYPAAANMSTTFFAIAVIILCYYNTSPKIALLVAVCAGLPSYNRGYMMFLVALALMLPKLAKNKNAWLQAWIVLSLLAFLYYPLYGAAVGVGMAPFALLQFVCLIREKGLLAKLLKKWHFYVSWLVVAGIVAVSAPLVFRLLEYMRIMSSQTLLADGRNILDDYSVPGDFLPYINITIVRFAVYWGIRFTLPAVLLAAIVYLIYTYVYNNRKNLLDYGVASVLAKLAAVPILLAMSYTYTLVRADSSHLLARTYIPLFAACIIMIVLLSTAKGILASATQKLFLCIAVTIFLLPSSMFQSLIFPLPNLSTHRFGSFADNAANLKSAYPMPSEFALIDFAAAEVFPLLGEGFGYKDSIEALADIGMATKNIRDYGYAVAGMTYLAYYAADLRVSGSPAAGIAKSKAGQLYQIQRYEKDRPVFLRESKHPILLGHNPMLHLNSKNLYYIHRWIMDSDYVVVGSWYAPREKASSLENGENKAASLLDSRSETPLELGTAPSELGNSLSSLMPLFVTGKEIDFDVSSGKAVGSEGYRIVFDNAIAGRDYDALYLELENRNPDAGASPSFREKLMGYYGKTIPKDPTPVIIRWKTADGLTGEASCLYGDGKLLFLLGANTTWLLSENTEISIHLGKGDADAEKIYVKKMKFMSVLLD